MHACERNLLPVIAVALGIKMEKPSLIDAGLAAWSRTGLLQRAQLMQLDDCFDRVIGLAVIVASTSQLDCNAYRRLVVSR